MDDTYLEVNQYLGGRFREVGGCDFYRFIFPDNERSGEVRTDFSKPNALYLYKDERDEGTERSLRRRILLDDTWEDDYKRYVERNTLTLCSGLSYRHKVNRLAHAQRMNALIIDLDGVGLKELGTLFLRFGIEAKTIRSLPMPTFLVASGRGLHVYYVFDTPIDLYPNIKVQLKSLKYDLTFKMWDYLSTSTSEQVQYQSINQGFRMVGSINDKYGVVLRAYETGGRVSLDYLNRYAKEGNRVDLSRPFRPSKMTRAEAREAYPEWYERVIENGKKNQLKKWDIKSKQGYALYDWWRGKVGEITGGHRYFYLMCLAIYACKCDVPRAKLEEDMREVFEELRKVEHENPLTEAEIKSALEAYDKEYYNFTIADIEKLTDVRIERNKRNYQNQIDHLEEARAIRDIRMKRQGIKWDDDNGRKPKRAVVLDYMAENPGVTSKSEIARETGLSRPTVYKYYDSCAKEIEEATRRFGMVPPSLDEVEAALEAMEGEEEKQDE